MSALRACVVKMNKFGTIMPNPIVMVMMPLIMALIVMLIAMLIYNHVSPTGLCGENG
ncbi:hypothetical protein [Flavobacterium sp. NKUCC04_CG]|uniref:hypothetical protein n=1 Tax=Flavobacterium sp. NKUCC04_CG TaxID=2842121 RepID=UPI001C5B7DD1|nr:hypothetical protein [Flavobacterium sp. NKUCC04_CG]MBW3519165.1 hypothetical protein [Flavobacterium sp. NKUCC04_CG]